MITGLRLEGKKESSLLAWTIRRPQTPSKVRIPLNQIDGQPSEPIVETGKRVRVGEKIAEPNGPHSVALHASISGQVNAIDNFPHPILGNAPAIEIISDDQDAKTPEIGKERHGWQKLSDSSLLKIFQESGLVGLGGKMAAVHANLEDALSGKVHTLIINGAESEPYLTADHALMMSHPVEILKGIQILQQLLSVERVVIAIEDNKLEPAELFKSKIFLHKLKGFEVRVLPTRYPQGASEMLIKEILHRKFPLKQPFWKNGAVVHNVATAFAVYEAVVLQKPLYERAVTVGGECVMEPKNIWLRIGTSFGDSIRVCRGLLREPRVILMGGPMAGRAQAVLDVPIIKGTQGILALSKEVSKPEHVEPCIRCHRCVDVCPVSISPVTISLAAEHNIFEAEYIGDAARCIHCGNCSYICPSKRPMVELVQYAASQL